MPGAESSPLRLQPLNIMRIELLALLFFQIRDALTQRQVNLRTSALSVFFLSCCVGIPKKVVVYVFE
jgi:hypothetical protein